tara:strand:- start:226 stop:588 length:363 start_codon:yes stop_codon:yes gene_type:complete
MNNQDITAKFIISCGNFGIAGESDPNIFAAYWGVSIIVKLGTINNGVIQVDNVTREEIKIQMESYLKDKCLAFPVLTENLPKIMERLHLHDDINEELVTSVAIQNIDNKIPEFYMCDHQH